jgi:hypothetical protein
LAKVGVAHVNATCTGPLIIPFQTFQLVLMTSQLVTIATSLSPTVEWIVIVPVFSNITPVDDDHSKNIDPVVVFVPHCFVSNISGVLNDIIVE